MKVAVFGTGVVGQAIAAKVSSLGHSVVIGTRDPKATMARADKDFMGNPPFRDWKAQHPAVELLSFDAAAAHCELAFGALSGHGAIEALQQAKAENLAGKILVDITNPLDFSKGMPPTLSVCNDDSLGERIQKALPQCKVVKTLNTVNAMLMVNPGMLAGGDHTMFVSGNDAGAKQQVTNILKTWFGWRDVVDLGDITTSRGTEMLLPAWLRLYGALKTPMFAFRVVR